MISPLNNHCLIEVLNEYDGIVGSNKNENVQKGYLRSANFFSYHLTASTGLRMDPEEMQEVQEKYKAYLDKLVYWQEFADIGSKFEIEGKQYVLVPFYRLIGVEA
jgi:hypothetical protein